MANLVSEQSVAAASAGLLQAAATMDEAALTATADELSSVATLLADRVTLRRLLTETTAVDGARQALAQRLFEGKIAPASLAVVLGAVGQRWSSGRDLVEGLRSLARTALFLRAERLHELDEVEDEIFRFGRILDANPQLALVLDDPAVSAAGRVDIITRLLAGKGHPLTTDLLVGLAKDPGGRTFAHGVAQLVEQAAQRQDKLVAIVTAARPLDDAELTRLRAALAKIYSRAVVVHLEVDPALGGGLTVRVGDEVIDGSISGRLRAIATTLAR